MPGDVYRTATDGSKSPGQAGALHGDAFVLPALLLAVGLLLFVTGIVGGRDHGTESGLGVVFLLFAARGYLEARRAARAER